MLLDKNGKLVKSLDFRGTSIEKLDALSAHELFLIITSAQQQVHLTQVFRATELAPECWEETVYAPILRVAGGDKMTALRLFGVVIKQALIISPFLFSQSSGGEREAVTYYKETLEF